MKIVFFANNRTALEIARFLKRQSGNVVAAVLHPKAKQRYGKEILEVLDLPESAVFYGDRLGEPQTLAKLRDLQPDIGLSVLFDYILMPECLELFSEGVYNLHPAFLPYNRGQYPNVWAIIEGTPAGVTLHRIDAGIDSGPIVAQTEVPVSLADTGATLYRKLEKTAIELFEAHWPQLMAGALTAEPQSGEGTYHRARDVEQIDPIDLNRKYSARELINILRARTFPPYPGAYFMHEGRKIYVRLDLLEEDELAGVTHE